MITPALDKHTQLHEKASHPAMQCDPLQQPPAVQLLNECECKHEVQSIILVMTPQVAAAAAAAAAVQQEPPAVLLMHQQRQQQRVQRWEEQHQPLLRVLQQGANQLSP